MLNFLWLDYNEIFFKHKCWNIFVTNEIFLRLECWNVFVTKMLKYFCDQWNIFETEMLKFNWLKYWNIFVTKMLKYFCDQNRCHNKWSIQLKIYVGADLTVLDWSWKTNTFLMQNPYYLSTYFANSLLVVLHTPNRP